MIPEAILSLFKTKRILISQIFLLVVIPIVISYFLLISPLMVNAGYSHDHSHDNYHRDCGDDTDVYDPTVELRANGATDTITVDSGTAVTLSWETTNEPTFCSATGEWTGDKDLTGGSEDITIPSSHGTYDYTISCSNSAGADSSTVHLVVESHDDGTNLPPVLTLVGSSSVNVNQGETFTDLGATAQDPEDGDITSKIVVTGSVDTAVLGDYTLTYNVTDLGGLSAAPLTRTVSVVSGDVPPIIPPVVPPTPPNPPKGGGGGGRGGERIALVIFNEKIEEISPGIVIASWTTNLPATRQVAYGTKPVINGEVTSVPNYQYENSTLEYNTPLLTSHFVVITGLNSGTKYYFRPVSRQNNLLVKGSELSLTPNGNVQIGGSAGQNACGNYLRDYLKMGQNNDPIQVEKLQVFLREFEGFKDLKITGVFDKATFDAVSVFQLRYKADILTPWGYSQPTGYVYMLTQKKINEIYCKTVITLTQDQQKEIENYRNNPGNTQNKTISSPISLVPANNATTTSVINIGTTTAEGTSTAENFKGQIDVLKSGKLGGSKLQNLAISILTFPMNLQELYKYLLLLVFILFVIYLFSNILVDDSLPLEKVKPRRVLYFIIGIILAIAIALLMGLYILVAPFLIIMILASAYSIWINNKKVSE